MCELFHFCTLYWKILRTPGVAPSAGIPRKAVFANTRREAPLNTNVWKLFRPLFVLKMCIEKFHFKDVQLEFYCSKWKLSSINVIIECNRKFVRTSAIDSNHKWILDSSLFSIFSLFWTPFFHMLGSAHPDSNHITGRNALFELENIWFGVSFPLFLITLFIIFVYLARKIMFCVCVCVHKNVLICAVHSFMLLSKCSI